MSCWVVPAIAAEFWGVTLDVVWDRIHSDLVPHKTEDGFVFIDVDPWGPNLEGQSTPPPPTFVMSPALADDASSFSISLDPAESRMLMHELPSLRGSSIYSEEIMLISGTALDENDEPERDSFNELSKSGFELTDAELSELEAPELEQLRDERGSATAAAIAGSDSDDEFSDEEAFDEDDSESTEAELPELDEEESATFTRMSWQDVRRNVGRTRRPPPPRSS
jgi:hypothetical protein